MNAPASNPNLIVPPILTKDIITNPQNGFLATMQLIRTPNQNLVRKIFWINKLTGQTHEIESASIGNKIYKNLLSSKEQIEEAIKNEIIYGQIRDINQTPWESATVVNILTKKGLSAPRKIREITRLHSGGIPLTDETSQYLINLTAAINYVGQRRDKSIRMDYQHIDPQQLQDIFFDNLMQGLPQDLEQRFREERKLELKKYQQQKKKKPKTSLEDFKYIGSDVNRSRIL